MNPAEQDARVAAFIDIGTNSIRLRLVRILPSHSFSTITIQREHVRLGEGEFVEQRLNPEAMTRAVEVAGRFVELCRSHGAQDMVAVATSATRDASNGAEFLHRLEHDAGLSVHVISGREEARLIYRAVLNRADLGDSRAVVLDIGGGSTEIVAGDRDGHNVIDSLQLGSLRLTTQLVPEGHRGPVGSELYRAMQREARLASAHVVPAVNAYGVTTAYGTSGTIRNLASVNARLNHGRDLLRDDQLTLAELKKVAKHLRGLSLDDRRKVPGLSAERADIIVAGAAVLEALMMAMDLDEIRVLSDCGVREGLLADYLERSGHADLLYSTSVRERSVVALARACGADERHATHVRHLALQLFDSAREEGLHSLGDSDRELLAYAAQLHDVGVFLSYGRRHEHTYYIIRNAELLGFAQDEIDAMATIALLHRKAPSPARYPGHTPLDRRTLRRVRYLAVLLRMGELLERSNSGVVREARLAALPDEAARLTITAAGDCSLELWGFEARRRVVEKGLGRHLEVVVDRQGDAGR